MLEKNGEEEKHIRERMQKSTIANMEYKKTWNKRKSIFKKIIREERR